MSWWWCVFALLAIVAAHEVLTIDLGGWDGLADLDEVEPEPELDETLLCHLQDTVVEHLLKRGGR